MTLKTRLRNIYLKIKCPLTSSIFTFTILYFIIFFGINLYTKSFDYSNTVLENRINIKMQQIAKKCGEDYYISFIALKSNDPKKYIFKDIVNYNPYSRTVRSVKYHNPFYQQDHDIDKDTFEMFRTLQTGDVVFPKKESLEKSRTFAEAFVNSNNQLKNISFSLIKYFNGNIRFVFLITSSKNSDKCSRQDITESLKELVGVVEDSDVI